MILTVIDLTRIQLEPASCEKVTLFGGTFCSTGHHLVHCSQVSILLMLEEGTLTPAGDFGHLDIWPVLVSSFLTLDLLSSEKIKCVKI